MGIFCCFTSDSSSEKGAQNDPQARHARIVEIYYQAQAQAENDLLRFSSHSTRAPPPAYNEIVDNVTITYIADEKPVHEQPRPQSQPHFCPFLENHDPIPSRSSSPQTSIISVPSTRLTDITSARTDATGVTVLGRHDRSGQSETSSLVFDSAPPSYWDGRSVRGRSRSPHPNPRSSENGDSQRPSQEAQRDQQHPVMREDWLQDLWRAAEWDARRVRES